MNKIGQAIVTLHDVAEVTGFHYSTVSLALRNDPRLAKKTRRMIQAAANRIGYRPNALVSLLMARIRHRQSAFRGTLAYVHTAPPNSLHLQGRVHRNYLTGATRRATELGYQMNEFFLDPERLNARQLSRVMSSRGITGLVIEHTDGPHCPNRKLPFDVSAYAVAVVGIPLADPELHYVANDQYMRAIMAAKKTFALGYRRLGLFATNDFDEAMLHRCSAGYWAVQEYTDGVPRIPICRTEPAQTEMFREWLSEHRPDVVLSTSVNSLTMIRESGLRVPEDIGWVHLDWLPEFKPTTGVYGNSEHTGAAAVDLVVSQLHRGESGPPGTPICHFVAGTWIPGTTVRKVGPPLDLDQSCFASGWHE